MAENYRNPSGRSEEWRGGRESGSGRSRFRGDDEQRFGSDRDDRARYGRGFEGERSYPRDAYSEEFGHRSGRQREDAGERGPGSRYYGDRGASNADYRNYAGDYERESRPHDDEGRFGGSNRFESAEDRGYRDRDLGGPELTLTRDRGTATSRWREDLGSGGSYFDTGTYVDDGDSWRGFGRDFERARRQVQQENDFGSFRERDRDTSGDYRNYGRSSYGAQSNYGRGEDASPWRGQQREGYEDRSSWNYGGQGAGSGSTAGAYAYDRDYGSVGARGESRGYASQSFRGRGPKGYQRSDERLKEMICERLTDDPAIDASNVTIEVNGQCVKLTGTVDDRSTKYEIEELVENFGSVKDIDNQLRVQSSRRESTGAQGSQQSRPGSDWEAGSGSTTPTSSQARGESRTGTGTTSGASAGTPSAGSTGRKN